MGGGKDVEGAATIIDCTYSDNTSLDTSGGGESMMGGESFEGGASTLDIALNALGFADAEAFAAWGQEASPELLESYGQLLSALIGG